ncbi:MAG: alpha/beta hydrolase [Thermoleophilia bacterium]|nr:alpha/beta hydrolase [Thermoleophilia bacterium]
MPSLPPAIELASTSRGRGPLVLGLHDLGKTGVYMQQVLAPLSDEFRVVAPDLRGHGASPTPKAPWSIDDFSSDASRIIAESGDQAIVVGVGLGAATAVGLALGHPKLVRALVLTGMAAKPEDAERDDRWARVAQGLREEYRAEGLALSAEALGRRPDWRRALAQVASPAVVVAGAEDAAVPPSAQRELAMWFPSGQFELVEGAGKNLAGEHPERLISAVRSLVESTSLRKAA